jgi:hypothetical protein
MTKLITKLQTLMNDNKTMDAPHRCEAIDELRIQSGAALFAASRILDNIATKISLRHFFDIDDAQKDLEDACALLSNGGNMEKFFDAVDAGEVDDDSMPGMLNSYFQPMSACDPAQSELQVAQAEAAVSSLDDVRGQIKAAMNVLLDDLDTAADLLFTAAERCMTFPESYLNKVLLIPADDKLGFNGIRRL